MPDKGLTGMRWHWTMVRPIPRFLQLMCVSDNFYDWKLEKEIGNLENERMSRCDDLYLIMKWSNCVTTSLCKCKFLWHFCTVFVINLNRTVEVEYVYVAWCVLKHYWNPINKVHFKLTSSFGYRIVDLFPPRFYDNVQIRCPGVGVVDIVMPSGVDR